MNNERRPILFNGQVYVESITKNSSFGGKEYKQSFDEARDNVIKCINNARNIISQTSKKNRLPNEIILSVVVEPEFIAKSFYPSSIFSQSSDFSFKEIGSRSWKLDDDLSIDEASYRKSKMFFVRTSEQGIIKFEKHLNKSESSHTKSFIKDIRKISNIQILNNRKILGVPKDWTKGRIEAVLHPFQIDRDISLNHFLNLLERNNIDISLVNYRQYDTGVTFVSFEAEREALTFLNEYNPLRTAHPISVRSLPIIQRGTTMKGGPSLPEFTKKSTVCVGIIDGGFDSTNKYVNNYTDSIHVVSGNKIPAFIKHGTQVTGTALYGPLNNYSNSEPLPEPRISARNFGVLSDETNDPDLYEAIDAIEKIIPNNKDISVYNLSLGPRGPILDDSINRFTYSCDYLSHKHNVLFCVAVGNDGETPGYDRIQSPSDSVNCLAVGATTSKNGQIIKAPYSCVGPGREGAKLKPDLSAFGGCQNHPIHLISSNENERILSSGTSFSTPIVAGIAARLIGESNTAINPLIAKAMLIHSSRNSKQTHSIEIGHGKLPEDYNEIITCGSKSYTLIYNGEIEPRKYAQYEIPWDNEISEGIVNFKWTLAVQPDVDSLSTDDYTSSSIEVSFFPNSHKYLFQNTNEIVVDGELKKSESVDISENHERAAQLIDHNWTKSTFPISHAAKKQFETELDLRKDLKWDSTDSREASKRAKSIKDPVFHIHAIGLGRRNGANKVKFALILSVEAPKAQVDLYANILNMYQALVPLKLTSQVTVDVQASA